MSTRRLDDNPKCRVVVFPRRRRWSARSVRRRFVEIIRFARPPTAEDPVPTPGRARLRRWQRWERAAAVLLRHTSTRLKPRNRAWGVQRSCVCWGNGWGLASPDSAQRSTQGLSGAARVLPSPAPPARCRRSVQRRAARRGRLAVRCERAVTDRLALQNIQKWKSLRPVRVVSIQFKRLAALPRPIRARETHESAMRVRSRRIERTFLKCRPCRSRSVGDAFPKDRKPFPECRCPRSGGGLHAVIESFPTPRFASTFNRAAADHGRRGCRSATRHFGNGSSGPRRW